MPRVKQARGRSEERGLDSVGRCLGRELRGEAGPDADVGHGGATPQRRSTSLPACGLVVAMAVVGVPPASAQSAFVGVGPEVFIGGGEGVAGSCLERSTALGSVAVGGRGIAPLVSVVVTARLHLREHPTGCVDGFPPQDGTYVDRERRNLLAHPFVASDLRVRLHAGGEATAPHLSLAAGKAFRAGSDLPYAAVAVGVPLVIGPVRLVLVGELAAVRVRIDLVERTWRNFTMVSAVPRGSVTRWSRARALALVLEAPFPP